jgi:hypothetical protein
VLLGYLVLRFAFDAFTEDDGLLTPGGAPNLAVAWLGLVLLVLRVVVVFVLPAVVAYRAVALVLERRARAAHTKMAQ